jgi:cytochrome c oxidase subunit IV
MSASDAESVRKEVKRYLGVFGALLVLTLLTVAVTRFDMPVVLAVIVALIIAAFKGSLVAAVFMHLSHEKKTIYWILVLTVLFFLFLMFIPLLTEWDGIKVPRVS